MIVSCFIILGGKHRNSALQAEDLFFVYLNKLAHTHTHTHTHAHAHTSAAGVGWVEGGAIVLGKKRDSKYLYFVEGRKVICASWTRFRSFRE